MVRVPHNVKGLVDKLGMISIEEELVQIKISWTGSTDRTKHPAMKIYNFAVQGNLLRVRPSLRLSDVIKKDLNDTEIQTELAIGYLQ